MADLPTLRLSELTQSLEGFFQKRFSGRSFWVIGEINSHKVNDQRGWHFFDLIEKDETTSRITARMSAVAWRTAFASIAAFEQETGQRFTNGIEVLLKAEVSFSGQYGLKLTVFDIDAAYTLGRMERQRRETLAKLLQHYPQFVSLHDGKYRTANQNLIVPAIVKRLAVVSSPTAAGYEDFTHTLQHNQYGYTFSIDFYQARVQGLDAANMLTRRLLEVSQAAHRYDLVVIIRGGGAQTDLFVFDDYTLNREIARLKVPLWTGIGHQRDSTIADLFCHSQFKTPTQVAEAILQHNRRAEEQVLRLHVRACTSAREGVRKNRQWLSNTSLKISSDLPRLVRKKVLLMNALTGRMKGAAKILVSHRKTDLRYLQGSLRTHAKHGLTLGRKEVEEVRMHLLNAYQRKFESDTIRLAELKARSMLASEQLLRGRKDQLRQQATALRLLSPENVLKRGYAMLLKNEQVIGPGELLQEGDRIGLKTSKQSVDVLVEKTSFREPSEGID